MNDRKKSIKIDDLIAIPNKSLPKDFNKAVSWLTRPYIPLTQKEYDYLMKKTQESNSDFVKDKDEVIYTFGNADGGFALMPIQREYYSKICKEN